MEAAVEGVRAAVRSGENDAYNIGGGAGHSDAANRSTGATHPLFARRPAPPHHRGPCGGGAACAPRLPTSHTRARSTAGLPCLTATGARA